MVKFDFRIFMSDDEIMVSAEEFDKEVYEIILNDSSFGNMYNFF